MIFAVLYDYTPDQGKILENRPAHRKYLNDLLAKKQLLAAGPITDDSGSLIVYSAADEHEVQRIIESDPFHKAGVFTRWQIKPWRVVFGNRELLPDGGPS
jgi:uncharacterized protein YciI